MIMPRRIAATLLSTVLLSSGFLFSQESSQQASSPDQVQHPSDQEIDLFRKDIQSQKKQLIAANMKLTDQEAERFWPVYDQYTAELIKINNTKYAEIKEFARSYDTLTDEQADRLNRQSIEVDESVAQLRLKYIPLFRKIISGKKTALFFQLDRRIVMMIDLQLSSAIPLVPQ